MIVYGDAVREETLDRALDHGRSEIDRALEAQPSAESLRRVLIHLGEIEQALCDAPGGACGRERGETKGCAAARAATHAAADAFERIVGAARTVSAPAARRARADLERARRALSLVPSSSALLRIRVPEGFAFYGLLPDRYRASAARWADEHTHRPDRDVLVVGVRSIGTGLSAVVAAALRARGFRVRRATVRPTGHPFARRVDGSVPAALRGIVVDEGPGLSGSSMLATADLLERSGVERVDLFPAHGSGPGAASTGAARRRWASLRSYVAGPAALEPGARDLALALWESVDALRGDEPSSIEDWGGGAWRARLYDDPSRWPASPRALERPKLLVTGRSGRRVLFKFSGLATAPRGRGSMAEALARRLVGLAHAGWTAPPLGVALGYVAHEWIDGTPCSLSDASPAVLEHMAAYVAGSSRGPLPPRDAREARLRLLDMVRVNTGEALGDEAARVAMEIVESSAPPEGMPGAGDGRMAPHEWIRTPEGTLVKTDAGGHDVDHTWVGRQPLPWDLAGALLEWDLHGEDAATFLGAFETVSGMSVHDVLAGYLVAYAAHRAGQSRLFADSEQDPLERGIQERAFARWRGVLLRLLADREERRGMVA